MPAERAGHTQTLFVVDVSQSMGKRRRIEQGGPGGEQQTMEMTNLEWALQYVKLKVQEIISGERETDHCGVLIFGSEETKNVFHTKFPDRGYEEIMEYIPISKPKPSFLAQLDDLRPSSETGDVISALIVADETLLASNKSWKQKIVLITDGENPIEMADWNKLVRKMNKNRVSLIIVGIGFDDEEFGFTKEAKSREKEKNEAFLNKLVSSLDNGLIVTYTSALTKPNVKKIVPHPRYTVLRIGDVQGHLDEAYEITVKTRKRTAVARPGRWGKYAVRQEREDDMDVDDVATETTTYGRLKRRTQYLVEETPDSDHEDEDEDIKKEDTLANPDVHLLEKEELVKGFKFGTKLIPCSDGQFPRLQTKKGIELVGFMKERNFRPEWAMGETRYIWADTKSGPSARSNQLAFSSIVKGMEKKGKGAVARWVSENGSDPKMGLLFPERDGKALFLRWVQMPFADDVRQWRFPSLNKLVTKKGEVLNSHPYLPTKEQENVMDAFVEGMDLSGAATEGENGTRIPWFSTEKSYNPSLHRINQAICHTAVVSDLKTHPLPPPHPELLKYFDPPKGMMNQLMEEGGVLEKLRDVLGVRQVPKRVPRTRRKDGHQHAEDNGDEEMLLLDRQPIRPATASSATASFSLSSAKPRLISADVDEEMLLLDRQPQRANMTTAIPPSLSASNAKPRLASDDGDEEMLLLDRKTATTTGSTPSLAFASRQAPAEEDSGTEDEDEEEELVLEKKVMKNGEKNEPKPKPSHKCSPAPPSSSCQPKAKAKATLDIFRATTDEEEEKAELLMQEKTTPIPKPKHNPYPSPPRSVSPSRNTLYTSPSHSMPQSAPAPPSQNAAAKDEDSATEDEEEEHVNLVKRRLEDEHRNRRQLQTPARSISPV